MRARIIDHEPERQPHSWRGTRVQVIKHKLYNTVQEACNELELSYPKLKKRNIPFTYVSQNGYSYHFDMIRDSQVKVAITKLYKNLVEACEVLDLSYNTLKQHVMPFTYVDENGYPMRFDRIASDQWRTVEVPTCRDCQHECTCNTGGVL